MQPTECDRDYVNDLTGCTMMLSAEDLWNEYIKTHGNAETIEKGYTSWYFCDYEECANELLTLVLEGTKCATASALWTYETEGEPVPAIGDLSVVTQWCGDAKCIIRTTDIRILPFIEVGSEFAELEGEGSKTLEEWRKVHWEYFTREMSAYGKRPEISMPVVCETFEVVYRSRVFL